MAAEASGTLLLSPPAESGHPPTDMPTVPPKLLAASTLAQFTVTNEQGMLLGQVENALVDWPTGQVQYAFLMFGRDPATADLYFAVPFAALDLNRQGQGFILHGDLNDYQSQVPLTRQALTSRPVVRRDFHRTFRRWPSGADAQPATPMPDVTPIPTVPPVAGSPGADPAAHRLAGSRRERAEAGHHPGLS